MIILDTNQLLATPPTSLGGVVLGAIADDAGIALAISELTLDEYRSKRLRRAVERVAAARSTHE